MKIIVLLLVSFFSLLLAQEEKNGKELFDANCAKCHATILGVANDGGYENTYITPAPYVRDLVAKLKTKTASKEEFTKFISEYIQNPNKRKSLYGKRAIKKFGLMPSLKGTLNHEEVKKLADYLYNYKENKNIKIKKAPKVTKPITRGERVFKGNCSKCHATILGFANDGGYDNKYITPAPYVKDLVAKLKKKTGSKEKFTAFISEYIQNPNKRKSLYGKKAIKEFGLMPSLEGAINKQDIKELSDYLYNYNEN